MNQIIIHDDYFQNDKIKALNGDYNGSNYSVRFIELFRFCGYEPTTLFDIWKVFGTGWQNVILFLFYLQKHNLIELIEDKIGILAIDVLEIVPPPPSII